MRTDWDTGDAVVDLSLRRLENCISFDNPDAESVDGYLSELIDILKLLPRTVARHFEIPYLYVGGAHYKNGPRYRVMLVKKNREAIERGMTNVKGDPSLIRGGGADFSDRPRTRGEEILAAITAFVADRNQIALSNLRIATDKTRISKRVDTIESLLEQLHTFGSTAKLYGQPTEAKINAEIYRIKSEAYDYLNLPLNDY